MHRLQKGVESHISDILITRQQESTKDVNGKNSETRFRLYAHNRKHSFVEDRITDIFGCFSISSNLGEDVIHQLTRRAVVFAEDAQETDNSH